MRRGSFRKIFMILFAAVMISGLLATGLTVSAETDGDNGTAEAPEEQEKEEAAEEETADENTIQVADVEEATAFAIYSETDNSLRFYKRTGGVPEEGDTYEGLAVTEVFTSDIEDISDTWMSAEDIPWHSRLIDVEIVVVEDNITPLNLRYWFDGAKNLKTADLSKLNTSKVSTFYCVFNDCWSLTSLDLSTWDTSNATTMGYLFCNCVSLTSLDVSTWDTSKVTNMCCIFWACSSLEELDLSSWSTKSLEDGEYSYYKQYMFGYMTSLWKITVGPDFIFYGTDEMDGNRFPTPSDDNLYSVTGITGATGNWYNTSNEKFSVANVPSGTADTYIAYPTYTVTLELPTDGSVTSNQETTVQVLGNGPYTVELTAANGYEISSVTADGVALAASGNAYTLDVAGDVTVKVTSSVKSLATALTGGTSVAGIVGTAVSKINLADYISLYYGNDASDQATIVSWSAEGLPDGLFLSEDGILYGTPTDATDGAVNVTVIVTAANGQTATFVLPVTISAVVSDTEDSDSGETTDDVEEADSAVGTESNSGVTPEAIASSVPPTGDDKSAAVWIVALAGAVIGMSLFGTYFTRKRQN